MRLDTTPATRPYISYDLRHINMAFSRPDVLRLPGVAALFAREVKEIHILGVLTCRSPKALWLHVPCLSPHLRNGRGGALPADEVVFMAALHDRMAATDGMVSVAEARALLRHHRPGVVWPGAMRRLLMRHGWVRVPAKAYRALQSVAPFAATLKRA